jgi:hypothetical protein
MPYSDIEEPNRDRLLIETADAKLPKSSAEIELPRRTRPKDEKLLPSRHTPRTEHMLPKSFSPASDEALALFERPNILRQDPILQLARKLQLLAKRAWLRAESIEPRTTIP